MLFRSKMLDPDHHVGLYLSLSERYALATECPSSLTASFNIEMT